MLMMEKKLGKERAEKVINAMKSDKDHFGFIKITTEELADLKSLYIPHGMNYMTNTFCFRAGMWVVMIVDQKSYIMLHLINPADPDDLYTAYCE